MWHSQPIFCPEAFLRIRSTGVVATLSHDTVGCEKNTKMMIMLMTTPVLQDLATFGTTSSSHASSLETQRMTHRGR